VNEKRVSTFAFQWFNLYRYTEVILQVLIAKGGAKVGLYKLNTVYPYLETAWFQPLSP
jgi:hypothetical protein